jgi:hypothetical protein
MFDIDQLHEVEQQGDFRYPPELWAVIDELTAVTQLPGFAAAFARAHLPTAQDILQARLLGMKEVGQIPFLCVPQADFTDYYCCVRDGAERSWGTVSVFCIHTVVAEWPSFAAFIKWARQLCSRFESEPSAQSAIS